MCSVRVVLNVQAAVVETYEELRGPCRFDENDDMVLEPLEVKRLLCAPPSACCSVCSVTFATRR